MALKTDADGGLDIVTGVREAYRWAPRAALRAWAPLVVSAAAMVLAQRAPGIWGLLSAAAIVAAVSCAYGALFRVAFEGDGDLPAPLPPPRPGGLAWGPPETAVGGAMLLFLLLFFLLAVAAAFAALLVGAVVYAVIGAAQGFAAVRMWTIGLIVTGMVLVFGWLLIRLSLSFAASARAQGVRVFTTWPLTRGQALRLLFGLILVGAPQLAVQTLAIAVGGFSPSPPLMTGLRTLTAVVLTVVQIPLYAGFSVWALRRIGSSAGRMGS